ncbi:MAG TPA: CpsB/CapC family capsule biosynthesis tyrosine phosphatase [Longimicrobiales bacterium]
MSDFDPRELADIHNHLVPGVDDGARTLGESLRHLRALAAAGVTRLAVSPHLDGRAVHEAGAVYQRLERLGDAFNELLAACQDRNDVPALVFGQEILVPDPETARALFTTEPRVGIAGTRFALIEFGFDLGEDPVGVVRAVLAAGRRPIVAHPERYRRDWNTVEIEEVRAWKSAGALLQVNGGSILGEYGEGIRDAAFHMLAEGLADLIATDNHADARPVSPADVGRALTERGLHEQARLLLSENPQRILADRETAPVAAAPFRSVA